MQSCLEKNDRIIMQIYSMYQSLNARALKIVIKNALFFKTSAFQHVSSVIAFACIKNSISL